jgi:hypothetical protein
VQQGGYFYTGVFVEGHGRGRISGRE